MTKKNNLVLVGFMGSGKSRIGQMLAEKLNKKFIDCDQLIENDQQKNIAEIFASEGETFFRNAEKNILKKISHETNAVIVTGGGAPFFFDNAQVLQSLGEIFFLDANFSLLLDRIKNKKNRPLVNENTKNNFEKLKNIFYFRRPIYKNLGTTIDVNHNVKEKTVETIEKIFLAQEKLNSIKKLKINSEKNNYEIFFQKNCLKNLKNIFASLQLLDHRAVIVTNKNLQKNFSQTIENIFQQLNQEPLVIAIEEGEEHKNFSSIEKIHQELFKNNCTRKTVILALGGGNIGDVAGFAASIFLRGIPVIQIPTTLLSMVDSSVGGKTGVDNNFGKNLVGSFYDPHSVMIDPEFLKTLPKEEYACGMAEVIKHAIISDQEFFNQLSAKQFDELDLIFRAVKVKAEIVQADPTEKNLRAHLNLGHTFAHAIEKVSGYKIKHGQAVAMGLVLAHRLAKRLNILKDDFEKALIDLLKTYKLEVEVPKELNKKELVAAMASDKKRDPRGLRFVLPEKISQTSIHYVNEADIFE